MLPTPSTSHVSFDTIYEPAEDSFLLLDTLSSPTETVWLHDRFSLDAHSPLLVEIGTGSGVVIAFLAAHAASVFGQAGVLTLGVDVNVQACASTAETVATASGEHRCGAAVYLGSVCADLSSSLRDGVVDVLVCNPPYVPTSEVPLVPDPGAQRQEGLETESRLLSLSYAGGVDGMETTYRLLKALPGILSPRGTAYVLLCARNRPDRVKEFVRVELGMQVQTVATSGKTAGWEKLQIIRIWR